MRTLSQAALSALYGSIPVYARKATLEIRVWQNAAYAYAAPVDISADIVETGRINFKLDKEGYGVWSYANCAVTVRNERNQWIAGNPDGYFPPGTEAVLSRIVLYAGVQLADGSCESQPVFTGYLSDGSSFLPEERTAQLSVISPLAQLANIDAQNAATFVTGELLGSASGTAFTTTGTGAGIIDAVLRGNTSGGYASAAKLLAQTDYSVSQLNTYALGAKITLASALSSGESLWINYRRWYRDQTVEALAVNLLQLAGITSYSVTPAAFTTDIRNTFSQATEAALETGTLSGTDWYIGGAGMALVFNGILDTWNSPGTLLSPVIDGTAALSHWGSLQVSQQAPDTTTSLFYYRDSTDAAVWSDWTAITPGDSVNSKKRYLQLKWYAANSASNPAATPVLCAWSVYYYTSATTIPLADMTGYSCQDALQELAQFASYETGFDAAGKFLFRPRAILGEAAAQLDETTIITADSISSGVDRVYNGVTVTYGSYSTTANAASQGEAAPVSSARYGLRTYEISGGNLLPAENVNLACAIAPTVWNYTHLARRRITVTCRLLFHLELGDMVTLTLDNDRAVNRWTWGDPSSFYGEAQLRFYDQAFAAQRLCALDMACRVEGIEHDLENWKTILDLTEAI